MGMATGYSVSVYKQFVGSLRNSGYKGHIILIVSKDPGADVEAYLMSKNVTMKPLIKANCTTQIFADESEIQSSHDKEASTCAHPYPYLKIRWSRFPLLRDYLQECKTCIGPVLVTDVRDSLFQRDPFGDGAPVVKGLHIFEEKWTMRTTNWLVDWPVKDCKNITFDEPMLCSGTTIGTRQAMLDYLTIMHDEMADWMKDPNCCCKKISGDDQSIHNYLFYTGRFPFAKAIPNRRGIVNTVGVQAAEVYRAHEAAIIRDLGPDIDIGHEARSRPFPGTENNRIPWIGPEYDMTDAEGFFTDLNGSRSRVIHQIDRFGNKIDYWMMNAKNSLGTKGLADE
jgi:hypothetical protein